ncbi:uncharacterized protein CLUP02_04153 [Colletotrichum lupini]|uniref:Uncharacterized protein n=1 Tax=Colletotrichum lupini TaxID=145971 RepID=A0A9Q8SJS3_9PEZI|nr:uncharacterized protein CLUP02_04153 [Colletotrichum lupini]UQC78676.1 hypothetical protein CLUP02_04153 [Colletotrichum lupini]
MRVLAIISALEEFLLPFASPGTLRNTSAEHNLTSISRCAKMTTSSDGPSIARSASAVWKTHFPFIFRSFGRYAHQFPGSGTLEDSKGRFRLHIPDGLCLLNSWNQSAGHRQQKSPYSATQVHAVLVLNCLMGFVKLTGFINGRGGFPEMDSRMKIVCRPGGIDGISCWDSAATMLTSSPRVPTTPAKLVSEVSGSCLKLPKSEPEGPQCGLCLELQTIISKYLPTDLRWNQESGDAKSCNQYATDIRREKDYGTKDLQIPWRTSFPQPPRPHPGRLGHGRKHSPVEVARQVSPTHYHASDTSPGPERPRLDSLFFPAGAEPADRVRRRSIACLDHWFGISAAFLTDNGHRRRHTAPAPPEPKFKDKGLSDLQFYASFLFRHQALVICQLRISAVLENGGTKRSGLRRFDLAVFCSDGPTTASFNHQKGIRGIEQSLQPSNMKKREERMRRGARARQITRGRG